MLITTCYEDSDLLAVEKPAGILSHPNPQKANRAPELDLESLVAEKLGKRPVLFHRLDRESSGLVLMGKTARVNAGMRKLFDDHKIRKAYRVVVEGRWPTKLNRLTGVDEEGREMLSTCLVLRTGTAELTRESTREFTVEPPSEFSVLEFLIKTGRRHQIRLQCRDAGHPVWNDRRYGAASAGTAASVSSAANVADADNSGAEIAGSDSTELPWIALHCAELKFRHPLTSQEIKITASRPAHWRDEWWA